MTTPPSPPPYGAPPPYGPPPAYGPPPYGPPPQNSSGSLVAWLLTALFVASTVFVAIAVHGTDDSSRATAAVPAPGGESAGLSSYPGPTYTPPTPTYSPPTSYVPSPTSTRQPLNTETIDRTFEVYMNALLNRSLSQLKSATCPRLRKTETGTALDGKYINRWQTEGYQVSEYLDYVIIPTKVRYINPNTGGNGGTHTYNWYVERYPDGHYWVCGIQ